LTPKDISKDERIPALLKRIDLVPINDPDDDFEPLKKRVEGEEEANA
jgi:hypothetical protein